MASQGGRQEEPQGGGGGDRGQEQTAMPQTAMKHYTPDIFNVSDTARQSIYAGPQLH